MGEREVEKEWGDGWRERGEGEREEERALDLPLSRVVTHLEQNVSSCSEVRQHQEGCAPPGCSPKGWPCGLRL